MMSGVAPGASGGPEGDDSRLALVALLIANLSVLVGVLWLGWDAVAVLLLYWHENLIIGVYTLLRMLRLARIGCGKIYAAQAKATGR